MGTLGTNADGFYSVYNPVVAAQADDPKLIAGFDTDIAAATFKPGAIQASTFNPISTAIGRATAQGDGQISALDTAMGGQVTTGAGGGGGGCASGGPPVAQSPQPGDFGNYSVPSGNVRVMNPRKLNDSPPQGWYISSLSTSTSAVLLHGDTAVWQLQVTVQKPENTGPPLYYVILSAKTGKAGHFGAVVGVTVQGQKQQLFGAVVDVGSCQSKGSSESADVLAQFKSKIQLPQQRASLAPKH